MIRQNRLAAIALLVAATLAIPRAEAAQCVVPDNGGGTVTLPPAGCDYLSPSDVHRIVDGLPAGTTIELAAIHRDFICGPRNDVCSFPIPGVDCDQPGGTLGGEKECSHSTLALNLTGTGGLGGFSRMLNLPIQFETHVAPRTPGAPVQSFNTDMFRLFGQISNIGDPDFDLLRIVAGTDFGLPSPGHTTLTQRPGGNWAVDSFFDINYRIDFVGAPGGLLAGMSGSTTGTIRMATEGGLPCASNQDCDDNNLCTNDSCQVPPCLEPDAGGTVALPPQQCGYVSPADVHRIINGLPPGTTIELSARHAGFFNVIRNPGGVLGGEIEQFDSSLNLRLRGTGALGGYQRSVSVPIQSETHVGPRVPGTPVQSFDTRMMRLQGQIAGDPDFDLLRITGGDSFGLPSPGHTTLTQLPGGNWAVDSYFDISYRVDFVGRPGGPLGGMSGSTTATIRVRAGGDGQCIHTPVDCSDNNSCTTDVCDPASGTCGHGPLDCNDDNACTVDSCIPNAGPPCSVPDNGGTAKLPPEGCGYVSPADVHRILDGLPPGTTIEIAAVHQGFFCPAGPSAVCSFMPPVPGTDCDLPGGTLGGEKECAGSTLALSMNGTGALAGFQRNVMFPIDFETHTAPRTPGQPVQSFDTDMFRLFGQISNIGDPDFDLLRIVAGTDFGLPSPGHTTLTQLPGGNWAVDSYFDISYRIDFVGRPGGALSGMSGSTTATIRMVTGSGGCVHSPVDCDDDNPCTIDSCDPLTGLCLHAPRDCDDGNPCTNDSCDPSTGLCIHGPANCDDDNPCTTDACVPFEGVPAGCEVPDNGGGTVTLPPTGCAYLSPDDVHEIIDGLPAGTTIEFAAIHQDFICSGGAGAPPGVCSFNPPVPGVDCDQPGGSLGGEQECADSNLAMELTGTGMLAGYSRSLTLPISFETHTAPRVPGQPVQSFDTDMFRLFGQISNIGDPDFDLLRIVAGTDFGLPSPGHTTLTQLPGGTWAVDSYFDISYRIDFVGRPGGALSGMSGSTTGTIRMTLPNSHCTHTPIDCNDNNPCTIDSCDPSTGLCVHAPLDCSDGNSCTVDRCNPATGECQHAPVNCDDGDLCTTDSCIPLEGLPPGCTVPDNGGGTVSLPPAGCDYLSPSDVHEIIDGLPAGTTIELGAIHRDFICRGGAAGSGVCSFNPPVPGVDCDQPGGTLGGEQECAESTLALNLTGTGMLSGYNRSLNLPISFETHVGPRTPGQPVQSFDTDMFRLFGQVIGDPEFDLLRIVAGTDFGLPSPGHTTLRQQPGGRWAVDSYFDISYRIDFVGSPGGPLAGRSGSTTGTIRMGTPPSGCAHVPVDCNDNNPCTLDSCNPLTGECEHAPVNCDDGIACTIDSCNPADGQCGHVPVPASAVGNAALQFPNKTTLIWVPTPDATHWNTYRGGMPPVPYNHTCFESGDSQGNGAAVSMDPTNPLLGRLFYYLVSGENRCGESSLGSGTFGPRPNPGPCPTPP